MSPAFSLLYHYYLYFISLSLLFPFSVAARPIFIRTGTAAGAFSSQQMIDHHVEHPDAQENKEGDSD